MTLLIDPKTPAEPRAPQPAPPVRQFSFTDFQVNNPTAPPPGDRLDAEIDRTNNALDATIDWAATSLNSDGSLKPQSVGAEQMKPGLFDHIGADAQDLVAPLVAAAEAAAGTATAAAAEADASALAAGTQNDAAQQAAGEARGDAEDAAESAAEAAQSALEAAASATSAADSANHADESEAIAYDYGILAQAWAEHMPDTIPPNILAVMDITGDHWSSRWWANHAHEIVEEEGQEFICRMQLIWMGVLPAPPTHNSCGDPVVSGTMYYDSTLGKPRTYDGSVWHDLTGLGEAPADGHLYARNGSIPGWERLPEPLSTVTIGPAPPPTPRLGDLWWDNVGGQLYVWYVNDPSGSSQWVIANSDPDLGTAEVPVSGVLGLETALTGTAVSGILIPYYLNPNDPYTDTNVQRLLGLMRQHHDVPVIVIVNPADGPGTFSANYENFIGLLKGAGGRVIGYVPTAYAARPSAAVLADIDLWRSMYPAIDGIFIDEMPWDTGPGNIGSDYVNLYKSYNDYCHTKGFHPVVANPGTNQQEAWFATPTADVIVVHEDLTWPSEASMEGNYAGGHANYSYTRRAALVYNQASLDTDLLSTLRKNVQWVYVTDDNLTGGVLNPWDTLPAYLDELFKSLAPEPPGGVYVGDTPPPGTSRQGDGWWDSTSGQLYVWYDDGSSSQWVAVQTAALKKYVVGFSFVGGTLGASQLLGLHKISKAVTIPADFGSFAGHATEAGATANATASTVISVDRALAASPNTFTQVGTLTFGAGGIAATFATTGHTAVSLAQGDVLRLQGPLTPDATLANVYATIVAQEA